MKLHASLNSFVILKKQNGKNGESILTSMKRTKFPKGKGKKHADT